MGQPIVPFRRRLAFQLFQLVREADECPFDHVSPRPQPGARILVILRRQVRCPRYCEQIVHRLIGAAEIMPRQGRRGDAQRFAEGLHLLCTRHALSLLVASQGEQAQACLLGELLLVEAADAPHVLEGGGEAFAYPTLPGIGLHGVVVGVDGGVVPLAEVVVELVLPQLVVVSERLLVFAHRRIRLRPSSYALDEEVPRRGDVGEIVVVAELEAVGICQLHGHEEEFVVVGGVVERGQRLRHDLQRRRQASDVLGLRHAPGELVVAHGGLVDARRLRDLLLGQPPQRPQSPQLLGEAVFLALLREEWVSHLHRIPALDVR